MHSKHLVSLKRPCGSFKVRVEQNGMEMSDQGPRVPRRRYHWLLQRSPVPRPLVRTVVVTASPCTSSFVKSNKEEKKTPYWGNLRRWLSSCGWGKLGKVGPWRGGWCWCWLGCFLLTRCSLSVMSHFPQSRPTPLINDNDCNDNEITTTTTTTGSITTKGTRDADASRAQVCYFFFLSVLVFFFYK